MIAIEIPHKKKYLYMPEELAECDGQQFRDFAKLLFWAKEGKLSFRDMKIWAVYKLLNLKRSKKQNPEKLANIIQLSSYINRFFEMDEEQNIVNIKLDFTKNHNPVYRLFWKYYGPEDNFADVTFAQYCDGLDEYLYYSNTGDIKALRMLFCIFHLRKGETYSYKKARLRSQHTLKFVDIRYLYGFYLFFSSMQTYVLGGEIDVMGNTIDLSIIYKSDDKFESEIPGTGLRNTISDLAESQVFGPYNSVRETNMWLVLVRLYELKKKELDEKARTKNNDSTRA